MNNFSVAFLWVKSSPLKCRINGLVGGGSRGSTITGGDRILLTFGPTLSHPEVGGGVRLMELYSDGSYDLNATASTKQSSTVFQELCILNTLPPQWKHTNYTGFGRANLGRRAAGFDPVRGLNYN